MYFKQVGAVQKTATVASAQFGKQVVLQKQGSPGTPDVKPIMTLVKTPQGMVVAPLNKTATAQASGSPQIVKTVSATGPQPPQPQAGKTIPQGATLVKLVSTGGAKPQTIVLNKPGIQATGQGGVKMIVLGSGQLAQSPNRPITISASGGSTPKLITLTSGSRMAAGTGKSTATSPVTSISVIFTLQYLLTAV